VGRINDLINFYLGGLLDSVSDRAGDPVDRHSHFAILSQILSGRFIDRGAIVRSRSAGSCVLRRRTTTSAFTPKARSTWAAYASPNWRTACRARRFYVCIALTSWISSTSTVWCRSTARASRWTCGRERDSSRAAPAHGWSAPGRC